MIFALAGQGGICWLEYGYEDCCPVALAMTAQPFLLDAAFEVCPSTIFLYLSDGRLPRAASACPLAVRRLQWNLSRSNPRIRLFRESLFSVATVSGSAAQPEQLPAPSQCLRQKFSLLPIPRVALPLHMKYPGSWYSRQRPPDS